MTANHPACPVIWGNTVEATDLTKREWLMAHFPLDVVLMVSLDETDEGRLRVHARLARIWADAIIKEAARDDR